MNGFSHRLAGAVKGSRDEHLSAGDRVTPAVTG